MPVSKPSIPFLAAAGGATELSIEAIVKTPLS